ncbi:MAG: hypothetical protein KatS3mg089_0585 [Patescibacteria group bacterium]|nr:MAG: hypothetical protein KatS3mg089_0585 [Patescibacteria group bacterium]
MRKVLLFVLPIIVIAVLIFYFFSVISRTILFKSHVSLASQNNPPKVIYSRDSVQNKKLSPTPHTLPNSRNISSSIPTPTLVSTPVYKPSVTPTAVTTSVTPTSSLIGKSENIKDYILQKINEFRVSQGLYKVQTDPYTCNFAQLRAEEISRSFNHDGFRRRIEDNSLPYPSYTKVTENIAMISDYTKVVDIWIASSGHAENMREDTPYVCIGQVENYFTYEGWRP